MVTVEVTKNQISFALYVPPTATILEVKRKAELFLDLKVGSQALFCNGEVLEEDRSLESYNFTEYAMLDLDTAPRQPKFYVLVKSSNKETLMKATKTTTVSCLKEKIERKWGVYKNRLILAHNHEAMSDDLPLSRYNVGTNSVVEVVIQDESR